MSKFLSQGPTSFSQLLITQLPRKRSDSASNAAKRYSSLSNERVFLSFCSCDTFIEVANMLILKIFIEVRAFMHRKKKHF